MNKNIKVKLIATVAAITQLCSVATSFAATLKGGGADSMYYQYIDFNDGVSPMRKSSTGATLESVAAGTDNNAVKITTTAGGKMGYIALGKLDFSHGPLVLSYDMASPSNASTIAYGALVDDVGTAVAFLPRIEGTVIKGYSQKTPTDEYATVAVTDNPDFPNGLTLSNSAMTYTNGSTITVQNSLDYDNTTQILTVKAYVNGSPLLDQNGNQYQYKMKRADMETFMESNFTVRFNLGASKCVIIDNVLLRSEGEVNLPNGGWIQGTSTTVTYADSAEYVDAAGEDVSIPHLSAGNSITSESQYELKKYNLSEDPFLFSGEAAASTVTSHTSNAFVVSGLSLTDRANEFFILKLKNLDDVKNFAGTSNKNPYVLLHSGLTGASSMMIRESALYNAAGEKISFVDGKLPLDTDHITVSVANASTLTAADVTFEGRNASVTATGDEKIFTLDLSGIDLLEGTCYTLSVGTTSKDFKTVGEYPYAYGVSESFDDSSVIDNIYNSDTDNIELSVGDKGLNYVNKLAATATTKYAGYIFGDSFDFSKGSMIVSYDVTLNQDIKYLGSGSYYLSPQVYLGDSLIGYMPAVEVTGIRARESGGGRTKVKNASNTMTKGKAYNVTSLFTLNQDGTISEKQYVDGSLLLKEDGSAIETCISAAVPEADLTATPSIRLYGRNLADGGVSIDNLTMTTVDGIEADGILEAVNGVASIDINSDVNFIDGAIDSVTKPIFTSSLTKDDITVKKHSSADTLLVAGNEVSDFTFDAATLAIGNLSGAATDVFSIELSDTSKIQCITGKEINTKYFKAGQGASGLIKTILFDINDIEINPDSNGLWPAKTAKVKFVFEKDYVKQNVSVNGLTAESSDNQTFVIDLSGTPLEPNTQYDVTVDGTTYGSFTTGAGMVSVSKPVIADDGSATVFASNSNNSSSEIYIINASFDSDGILVDLVYSRETVNAGTGDTYTVSAINLTGAAVQKVFVWDGFEKMIPLCEETIKNL